MQSQAAAKLKNTQGPRQELLTFLVRVNICKMTVRLYHPHLLVIASGYLSGFPLPTTPFRVEENAPTFCSPFCRTETLRIWHDGKGILTHKGTRHRVGP
jgi:hypothetical protein